MPQIKKPLWLWMWTLCLREELKAVLEKNVRPSKAEVSRVDTWAIARPLMIVIVIPAPWRT